MIKEEGIQKAKDATFPIPEGGRSYEQSLAASGFELDARRASAFNEPNISFKEQMIRSCIEIALTDVSEKRFSDYGTSLKECLEWIEEQQNKIAFYEKQSDTTSDIRYDGINAGASLSVVNGKPFDYEHATITQKDFACDAEEASYTAEVATGDGSIKSVVSKKVLFPNLQSKEWSGEDFKRIDYICDFIWKNRKGDTDEIYQQEQDVKWLKSLKQRIGWKPSKEQIHAFEQVYEWYNNNFAPSETLTSLYNDLKKL